MKEENIVRVRLSLDLSPEEHLYLKMSAAKRGVSMREYILEAVSYAEVRDKNPDRILDDATFDKELERIRKEKFNLARNLSKR